MSEASAAQSTLKRLVEAEEQARAILREAEERSQELIAKARQEAQQTVMAVRQEMSDLLQSRLRDAESRAAVELKQGLEQAEAEAQDFERRANEHFSEAVEMVVNWVTSRDR